jgi:hypothetical protein
MLSCQGLLRRSRDDVNHTLAAAHFSSPVRGRRLIVDSTTSNVPDTIREQAKQRALKIIQSTPDAISFVNPQELETQSLFIPVITILKATQEDFHNLRGGVKMPKSHYTNMIAEATGVNITDVRVRKGGEFIWQGHAEGNRRLPDGTMRPGAGEYEFDAEKRAEEDWLAKPDDYKTDIAKRKHVLEYARFGMQRASTGARLALIRYLAEIPTGFTQETIQKAMIFNRIDRNVNGMMADPAMHEAIIQHALGATETVFGPKQITDQPGAESVSAESAEQPAAAQDEEESLFEPEDSPEPPFIESEEEKVKRLREQLALVLENMGPKNRDAGRAWLANSPESKDPVKLAEKIAAADKTIAKAKERKAGAA